MLFSSDRRSNRYRRIWVGDRGTTHSASSGGVWRDLALWTNTPSLGQEAPRQDGIGEACSECEQRLCEYSCPLQLLSWMATNWLPQPFTVAVPAGTTCTGTVGGQSGVCLVKLANPNPAGPFGGVFAMQVASASNTTTTTAKRFVA